MSSCPSYILSMTISSWRRRRQKSERHLSRLRSSQICQTRWTMQSVAMISWRRCSVKTLRTLQLCARMKFTSCLPASWGNRSRPCLSWELTSQTDWITPMTFRNCGNRSWRRPRSPSITTLKTGSGSRTNTKGLNEKLMPKIKRRGKNELIEFSLVSKKCR